MTFETLKAMSKDYSVFIKKNHSITEIKLCLEKTLNCSLKEVISQEGIIYSTKFLGLNISLQDEIDYIDDVIRFSEYGYEIIFDYIRNEFIGYYSNEWRELVSIIIADILSKKLKSDCIAVRNLHTILSR